MSENRKIYFAGSIRGGRQDADLYLRIVEQLKTYGTVLTEHVASPTVETDEDNIGLTDVQIHDRDMDWLNQSDVLVAEVTQPSLGVGYEIGRAVALGKVIICLFRPDSGKKISAMISGAVGEKFFVYNYKEEQVPEILAKHLK
ncbi:putative 2'-deoxynucleoside 5'-phosphate N-hydrolase 1 [Magallana gigas]|uniref:Putative 2'-deoxynucleoside 5'-phosphate N-hydrolase 1 n=1 Tax=Magallana gigas TaxID=29159 RepID=K1PDN3_MAGGI|eukprot:XP_011445855.1 PREDICTED: putative 2'-deoxynucleoside 5'-phosphate N-hydrolase 1 [Crassostrea gigas]